jgi:hypothetical protein
MKTLKLSLIALFISAVSFAQKAEEKKTDSKIQVTLPSKANELKWATDTHDFGEIEKGKPVSYEFTFVNTTKETVLITNVKPSCGCTATNYTKTPIKPGEKAVIEATYNAASPGVFQKTVSVTTNDENAAPKVLTIKGKVKSDEKAEEKSVLMK